LLFISIFDGRNSLLERGPHLGVVSAILVNAAVAHGADGLAEELDSEAVLPFSLLLLLLLGVELNANTMHVIVLE
jgi:hypothetical protein